MVKNSFKDKNKVLMAEVVGVFLGDGCLHKRKDNNYSAFISSDKREIDYVNYLKSLFLKIYQKSPFQVYWDVTQIRLITRHNIANHLQKYGIIPCNKVKNKVRFPKWILG